MSYKVIRLLGLYNLRQESSALDKESKGVNAKFIEMLQKTIDKIDVAHLKKLYLEEQLPVKDTVIELKIQNFLNQLELSFLTHQQINIKHDYQCNIFIPSLNTVIECDGTYWHKYPEGREIDRTRTEEMIKEGFKVLRLWEKEIKSMNLIEFKKVLENEVWVGNPARKLR